MTIAEDDLQVYTAEAPEPEPHYLADDLAEETIEGILETFKYDTPSAMGALLDRGVSPVEALALVGPPDEDDAEDVIATLCDAGVLHDEALVLVGWRPRDLPPAARQPVVRSPRRSSHASPEPPLQGPRYRLGADGDGVALGEADGPDVVSKGRRYDTREDRTSGDQADRWLKAHDPRLTTEGVVAEVRDALAAAGLSDDDVVEALPGKRGRPSAETLELRERLRDALGPIHEDGRNRDHMARALRCSRRAIERLMA